MPDYDAYFADLDYAHLLRGRYALITGGAAGIGLETALLFARQGAAVAIADCDETAGNAAQEALQKISSESFFIACNLENQAEVHAMTAAVLKRFPVVDVLVLNAGLYTHGLLRDISDEEALRCTQVNYLSAVSVTRDCLPGMMERRRGNIIAVTSDYVEQGIPGVSVFAGAKAALQAFTRAIAMEYVKFNIRANCVAPGASMTSHGDAMLEQLGQEEAENLFQRLQPIPHRGSAEDAANAILFLASPMAQNLVGECLPVSGGEQSTGHNQIGVGKNHPRLMMAPRRYV